MIFIFILLLILVTENKISLFFVKEKNEMDHKINLVPK